MKRSRQPAACPTPTKHAHWSHRTILVAAKMKARDRISRGVHFDPVYSYRCPCGAFHLTRMAEHDGQANEMVWEVPDALQVWAREG